MHISEILSPLKEEEDSGQGFRFDKSLQELRDLRSQLHYAADYCETTFLNSKEKRSVVENTREYICKAVVTFVDHLGNVSANLNHSISETDSFSEAELRIYCLQQRLLSCEQFAHKLALTRVKWNPALPRHHRRYLSARSHPNITSCLQLASLLPLCITILILYVNHFLFLFFKILIAAIATVEKSNENPRNYTAPSPAELINKHELKTDGVPLFFFTCTDKPSLSKSPSLKSNFDESDSGSTLVAVRDGLSILSKSSNPTFHFQQGNKKHGRKGLYRKALPSGDFLAFIRRTRRSAAW